MIGSATEEAYELTPGNAGDVGGSLKIFFISLLIWDMSLK